MDRLVPPRLKSRLSVVWLALCCAGFLTAAGWLMAAEPAAPKGQPAPGAAATAEGHFQFLEVFRRLAEVSFRGAGRLGHCPADRHCGTGLRPHVGHAGAGGRAGDAADAGDRRGRARRGQRLSFGPGPQDRPADRVDYGRPVLHEIQPVATRREGLAFRFWPVNSLLVWFVVQPGGGLERHEAGHHRQSPRRRRRPPELRRGDAVGLSHRNDHRHVDRRAGAVGRHLHLHGLRRAGV